ncbi:MAG: ribonuclease III, partial [Clostridiaceae bacterium]|nr:ribonuclease III [Clostridiaceae bacterium]
MNKNKLNDIEKILGYSFTDKSLLTTALTHSSYANEQTPKVHHNQRLEFLGDAVLELIISEHIYKKNPGMHEGELTKLRAALVCEDTLYKVASDLCLNEYILLGVGESQRDVRMSIMADCFESIVAAIFLDGGFKAAKNFIARNLERIFEYGSASSQKINYKTELQEKYAKTHSVVYTITDVEGPEH